MKDIVRAALSVGRGLWRSFPLMLLVASVWALLAVVFARWPWVQIPILIFGLAPLVGGTTAVCAEAVRGQPNRVASLFGGFKAIDRWTGVVVMSVLHFVLALLPVCVGIAVANLSPRAARMYVIGASVLVSLPLLASVVLRLIFVPVAALDAPRHQAVADIFESAFARSKGRGRSLFIVLIAVLVALVAAVRIHAFIAIAAFVVAQMILVALYDQHDSKPRHGSKSPQSRG